MQLAILTSRASREARYNASSLYIELRRFCDAIVQAEKALLSLQKEQKLRSFIADKSLKSENKRIEMISTHVGCLFNIGRAEATLGNSVKMTQAYKRAVELCEEHLSRDHSMS